MSKQKATLADEASRCAMAQRAMDRITTLQQASRDLETHYAQPVAATAPASRESARNLIHYLAVRSHDIRDLQADLARLGLSSLGRMEAHAKASLHLVAGMLHLILRNRDQAGPAIPVDEIDPDQGTAMQAQHAKALHGPVDAERSTRIMVTMPGEAAENPALIRDLLAHGMQIMRINCAHDKPSVWARMLLHLRCVLKSLTRRCPDVPNASC